MTSPKHNSASIAERLSDLGYGYYRDDLTPRDGRMTIYAFGNEGYAIDRMDAKEAAEFCNLQEGNPTP